LTTRQSASTRAPRSAPVALKAFAKIADRWGLECAQKRILLATTESTLRRWSRNPESAKLGRDQLERISYVLGIFAGLHQILGDTALADEWVKRPNSEFGNLTPLARMLGGNVGDLFFVRSYVDRWVNN
jgi:uncharacterized protein (DUF2384 family)